MIPRRSFLKSLVAAVALSPLLSRLIEKPGIAAPNRIAKEVELWDQKPVWDGTLSPYFLKKYGVGSQITATNGGIVPTGAFPQGDEMMVIKGSICPTEAFAPYETMTEMLLAISENYNAAHNDWFLKNPEGTMEQWTNSETFKSLQCS
jgi:hypothetical protein